MTEFLHHFGLFDAFHQSVGSVDVDGHSATFSDAFGHPQLHVTDVSPTEALVQGQFGQTLGHVIQSGTAAHVLDPLNQHVGSIDFNGGHVKIMDDFGWTEAQIDPLTGTISNALGMRIGAVG